MEGNEDIRDEIFIVAPALLLVSVDRRTKSTSCHGELELKVMICIKCEVFVYVFSEAFLYLYS